PPASPSWASVLPAWWPTPGAAGGTAPRRSRQRNEGVAPDRRGAQNEPQGPGQPGRAPRPAFLANAATGLALPKPCRTPTLLLAEVLSTKIHLREVIKLL